MSRILAIGGAYLDLNCPDFPFNEEGILPEKELVSDKYVIEPGGSAINFARLSVALGLKAGFIGKVGADAPAQVLEHLLNKDGVESWLIRDSTVITNLGINFVNAEGKMVMAAVGTANQSLQAEELVQQVSKVLPKIDYLYLGGIFKLIKLLPAFTALIEAARTAKVRVVLDHSRSVQTTTSEQIELVRNLALKADYYLPSRDEFLKVWELDSIERGLEQLRNQTDAVVVVKDGSKGAVSFTDSKLIKSPAFTVKPNHTVGAGDSFNAGFMAGLEAGLDLKQSMEFGCATAALKISQAKLPTRVEVKKLIAGR